jgi:hypothetical protein
MDVNGSQPVGSSVAKAGPALNLSNQGKSSQTLTEVVDRFLVEVQKKDSLAKERTFQYILNDLMPALRRYSQSGFENIDEVKNSVQRSGLDRTNLQYSFSDIQSIEPASRRLKKLLIRLNKELLTPNNFFIWDMANYGSPSLTNVKICFIVSEQNQIILNKPIIVYMGLPVYKPDNVQQPVGVAKFEEESIFIDLEEANLKAQDPWKSKNFQGDPRDKRFFDAVWGLNDALRVKYGTPERLLVEQVRSTLTEEMQHIRDNKKVMDLIVEGSERNGQAVNLAHVLFEPTFAETTQKGSFINHKFLHSTQNRNAFQGLFPSPPASYKIQAMSWATFNVASSVVESSGNLAQCAIADPKLSILKWLNYFGQFETNMVYGMMGAWNLYMLRANLDGSLGQTNLLPDQNIGLMEPLAYADIGLECTSLNDQILSAAAERTFNSQFVDRLDSETFKQVI